MTDRRRAGWLALAGLAGLLLSACGDDEAAGALEAAPGATIEGAESFVQLPHGRVVFEVGDAEAVDDDALAEPGAGEGEMVGVGWSWQPGEGVPDLAAGFLLADDVPAEVRVRVGETWHDLGPAYDTSAGGTAGRGFFVPAGDDVTAEDVTLLVDFDGVEQTVRGDGSGRDAGAAAPVYDLAHDPVTAPCAVTLEPASARGETRCEATFLDLPYVTDLGWASSGSTWLLADVTVTVSALAVGGQEQRVVAQAERTTLGGAEPAAVVHEEASAGGLRTQSVFEVPAGEAARLEFTRTLTAGGETLAEVTGSAEAPAG